MRGEIDELKEKQNVLEELKIKQALKIERVKKLINEFAVLKLSFRSSKSNFRDRPILKENIEKFEKMLEELIEL